MEKFPDQDCLLTKELKKILGEEYSSFVSAKLEPSSIRINPLKTDKEKFENFLRSKSVRFKPHPLNPLGYVIEKDPLPLSHSLLFYLGHFAYQGASSQIPVLFLDPKPGEKVLDMAAAPGSKSTQIAALMENRGRLYLNDASVIKQKALNANLARAQVMNACTTSMPGERFGKLMPGYFDRVLVDAPCSCLNHYPGDILDYSLRFERKLPALAHIQKSLLISALKCVREEGVIVYSTCTINPGENEEVVEWFLKSYPVEIEDVANVNLPSGRQGLSGVGERAFDPRVAKALRIHPFPEPMEGFFIAKFRKTGSFPVSPPPGTFQYQETLTSHSPEMAPYLELFESFWGIDKEHFVGYKFVLRPKKLWLISSEWDSVPLDSMYAAGLPLLYEKGGHWNLTNSGAQLLGCYATKRKMEISEAEMKTLFQTKRLEVNQVKNGFYLLSFKGLIFATGFVLHGTMSIRLPYEFRQVV